MSPRGRNGSCWSLTTGENKATRHVEQSKKGISQANRQGASVQTIDLNNHDAGCVGARPNQRLLDPARWNKRRIQARQDKLQFVCLEEHIRKEFDFLGASAPLQYSISSRNGRSASEPSYKAAKPSSLIPNA